MMNMTIGALAPGNVSTRCPPHARHEYMPACRRQPSTAADDLAASEYRCPLSSIQFLPPHPWKIAPSPAPGRPTAALPAPGQPVGRLAAPERREGPKNVPSWACPAGDPATVPAVGTA